MPPLRPSFPMILLLAAHVAVLSGAGLAKASMPSGEVRTAWHRALLASGHKTHHAHKGATRGPNLTNLGMPALDGASGPFRRMEITNELDYAQAIDNLLGPTREPDELLKPLCDEACTRHNYRHIRTPPSAVQALKILVVLDSHCASEVGYDYELESFCNHPEAYEDNEKCQQTLPFAYYNSNFDRQREIKGYYKSAYTAVFRRAIPFMKKQGWESFNAVAWDDAKFNASRDSQQPELWPDLNEADVVITTIGHFREIVVIYPDKRFILVSTNDAATLSTKLGCDIEDGRIIAVLQHTALEPLAENNGALRGDRRHFMWFPKNETRDALVPTTYRIPELDKEGGDKIQVLIPQVYRWRWPLDCGGRGEFTKLQPAFHHDYAKYTARFKTRWGKSRPSAKDREKEVFLPYGIRKYDISYIGTINHGSTREIYGVNEHRQMAVDAIHKLKQKYPDLKIYTQFEGKMRYDQFIEVVKDSKVFVSPFGLGEFSGKDYEAALSGTLLVKPAAEMLKSYPNIYLPNSTINVKIDYSDLEDAVMPFIRSPAKAKRRIIDVLERLKHYSRMETFSADLHRFLVRYLLRPVTYDPRGCYPSPTWFFDEMGIRKPSLVIKHIAAQRLRAGEPFYDPDPIIDGDEIMNQLEEEEQLREMGIMAHHVVSRVPKVNASSRHTDVLDTYSHIVHSWLPWANHV